jgi:hypothetical protein
MPMTARSRWPSASALICLTLAGCGEAPAPLPESDIVFDITRAPSLPDGRPVVDIKPNGKPRPAGTAPSNGYFLMVRRNGSAYYTRWFHDDEAAKGIQRDLAIPTIDLKPGDKLTVGVENIYDRQDSSKYTRLSDVLDLTQPPPSAPSFAIPIPRVPR